MTASLFFGEIRLQAPHLVFPRDNTQSNWELTALRIQMIAHLWCDLIWMNSHQRKHGKLFCDNKERTVFINTPQMRSANVSHEVTLDKEHFTPLPLSIYRGVTKIWNSRILKLVWQNLNRASLFVLLWSPIVTGMVGAGPTMHKHNFLSFSHKCPSSTTSELICPPR